MSGSDFRIVTDSTADIPSEIARALDITVIPCQIQFAGQTYRDGVDITHQELHRRLKGGELFTTSQPPIGIFAQTYRQLLQDGRQIISIHLAAGLSAVYNAAYLAAQEVAPERITLIDSQQVSMCIGWLAIEAAEAARRGQPASETIEALRAMVSRLRLLALIDDLRFIQRSGRVNWVAGLIGSLFAIKPIALVRDSQVHLTEKVRSFPRGVERLASLILGQGPLARIAVLHSGCPDAAEQLASHLRDRIPGQDVPVMEAGIIVSAHAGPGAVGAACLLN